MHDPFANRSLATSGPATDALPVVPSDAEALPRVALALYIETGGTLRLRTAAGELRELAVPDFCLLPLGARQVMATGTTASGIHAMTLA